jgi:hypothetical protein
MFHRIEGEKRDLYKEGRRQGKVKDKDRQGNQCGCIARFDSSVCSTFVHSCIAGSREPKPNG